jgi:hypothetical protein
MRLSDELAALLLIGRVTGLPQALFAVAGQWSLSRRISVVLHEMGTKFAFFIVIRLGAMLHPFVPADL